MSSAAEWATFGLDVVKFVIGIGLTVLQIVLIYIMVRAFWHHYTEGKHGNMPQARVLARRLWCRHREVAYIGHPSLVAIGRLAKRDPRTRRCVRCGVDIDGSRREVDRR